MDYDLSLTLELRFVKSPMLHELYVYYYVIFLFIYVLTLTPDIDHIMISRTIATPGQ